MAKANFPVAFKVNSRTVVGECSENSCSEIVLGSVSFSAEAGVKFKSFGLTLYNYEAKVTKELYEGLTSESTCE